MAEPDKLFDFKTHEEAAVTAYLKRHGFYTDLASVVKRILEESLKRRNINVHSVNARAKDPSSFGKKASQPSDEDPTKPKYTNPLVQITDLAGIRIITYFPSTLAEIDDMPPEEFSVIERTNKGAKLIEEDRFGYQSIHYLVKLTTHRTRLPEYGPFADTTAEIQVRTILQHAWAEIEHDIQYKSTSVIPTEIRRRFMSLAGMLEIADREFQAIQDADRKLTDEARSRVEEGQLDQVEVTPDSVKAFLDKRLGRDGRISDFSYIWVAKLLKKLGFETLDQVESCIHGYSDDHLSRIAGGGRHGQTTRFEYMLLAGMGENFLQRHLWANEPWFQSRERDRLERMKNQGVETRAYDPMLETSGAENEQGDISPKSDAVTQE